MKGFQGQILEFDRKKSKEWEHGRSSNKVAGAEKMKTETVKVKAPRKTFTPSRKTNIPKVSVQKEGKVENRGKNGVNHELNAVIGKRFQEVIMALGYEKNGEPNFADLRDDLMTYLGKNCPSEYAVRGWAKGKSRPNPPMEDFLDNKGINLNWMSTGRGKMFLSVLTELPEPRSPLEEPQLLPSEETQVEQLLSMLFDDSEALALIEEHNDRLNQANQAKAKLAERLALSRKSA